MAFTEIELARYERELQGFMKRRRPPAHIRAQLDYGYKISGQSVELYEIRPYWQDESKKMERPFAKATFVRTKNAWRVYWQMSDLKWHGYEPNAEVNSLARFLEVVHKDEHCCFFG